MARAREVAIAVVLAACGGGGGGGPGVDGRGSTSAASPDEFVDACVKLGGCQIGGSGLSGRQSACIDYLQAGDPASVRCIAHATTCSAVLACAHLERIEPPSCTDNACSPDGNAVYCAPGQYDVEEDCSATGDICAEGPNGDYCSDPCSSESCVDGVLDRCDHNRDVDCNRLGWTCDPAGPRCSDGTAVLCTPSSTDHCDGGDLIECVDGYEMRLDCNRLVAGTTCQTAFGVAFCGTAGECHDQTQYCSPDTVTLTMCALGKVVSRDCTSYGFMFSGCANDVCFP